MIILGAGGHATEVLDILTDITPANEILLIDDTIKEQTYLFNKFQIATVFNNIPSQYGNDFVLGVGNCKTRQLLLKRGLKANLNWSGIRSNKITIGKFNSNIDECVDIMQGVIISSDVNIDKGTLINRNVTIHHGSRIGKFCEIAPNATLLGSVTLGNYVFVGAGAIILPNITIGDHAIIGAGTVVNKNVTKNSTVVGSSLRKLNND